MNPRQFGGLRRPVSTEGNYNVKMENCGAEEVQGSHMRSWELNFYLSLPLSVGTLKLCSLMHLATTRFEE